MEKHGAIVVDLCKIIANKGRVGRFSACVGVLLITCVGVLLLAC